MAEVGASTCPPEVFVVDSQATYVSLPSGKKSRWTRMRQKLLLLVVGFTALGVIVEGCLIYNLYKQTETFSCKSHPHCQNLSDPKTSGQQGGTIMSQVGPKESNEIPTSGPHPEEAQQRPFAQLMGDGSPVGENNVVQWLHKGGETITHNMRYDNGRLLVEKGGHYYIFSKLTLNAAEECSLIQHKVMKITKAYDRPIELMKSKSFRCWTPRPSSMKHPGGEDLWNSFLAGIFQLQEGDEIFVTLEDIQKLKPGTTDNLMGAFMISS